MQFYVHGQKKVVMVDDYVPVYKKWDSALGRSVWAPRYASSQIRGEVWPIIAEKIVAKLFGNYGKIGGGGFQTDLYRLLSNRPFKWYVFSNYQNHPLDLWDKMKEWAKKKYLMFTGTDYSAKGGLVASHAWTILDVDELNVNGKTVRAVKMFNPWASHRWDRYLSRDQ